MVRDEYELTKRWVLDIAGQQSLMERNRTSRRAWAPRRHHPSAVGHQHLPSVSGNGYEYRSEADVLKRLVVRSMFGIINASRNAV